MIKLYSPNEGKEGLTAADVSYFKDAQKTPTQQPVEERENIIKQDFSTTTINEKWVEDITYINPLLDG